MRSRFEKIKDEPFVSTHIKVKTTDMNEYDHLGSALVFITTLDLRKHDASLLTLIYIYGGEDVMMPLYKLQMDQGLGFYDWVLYTDGGNKVSGNFAISSLNIGKDEKTDKGYIEVQLMSKGEVKFSPSESPKGAGKSASQT